MMVQSSAKAALGGQISKGNTSLTVKQM
eukprot:IDg20417t1